jgi:hypothetical protein
MDSAIYPEIFVLTDVLPGDVLRDPFISNVPITAAENTLSPKMSSPELLCQNAGTPSAASPAFAAVRRRMTGLKQAIGNTTKDRLHDAVMRLRSPLRTPV